MTNNKYKQHIENAKKILSKKNFSDCDLETLEKELDTAYYYNDFNSDYQLINLYGKFYFAKGNIKKAKEHFNLAIEKCPHDTPKASFYGLFKTSINEEDFELAIKELALYDSCFDKNFNMKFYFKCLNKLLELNGQKVNSLEHYNDKEGYINCVKAPKSILELYKKAEKYFDNCDYKSAYKTLYKAQSLCINNNYLLDFSDLMKVIFEIYSLYIKAQNQKPDYLNRIEHMDSNNDKKEYLKKLIDNPINVSAMIKLIEILISEENYDEAYSCFNHQMDKNETNKYIKKLNLLRKKVFELYDYKHNETKIKSYLQEAQKFIDIYEIKKAIDIYKRGYEDLGSPIFLFKMGEINYLTKNISKAKKYFVKYMDKGCKYEDECYLYLGYINLITKKDSDIKEYFKNENLAKKYSAYDNYCEKKNSNKYFERFFGNKNVPRHLLDLDEKIVAIYLDIIKSKVPGELANKDKNFINYCNEILNSIKHGELQRIEKIDQNRHDPLEIALIQILAAPILLDMGSTYLAEKYYQRALIFTDDEDILKLTKRYEQKKNERK